MIPEIRATVDELSCGVDNTNFGELMAYETWLRAQVWRPDPRRGSGLVLDSDMERAAEAFRSLVVAYKLKDWNAIKEHARTAYQALI